MFSCDGGPEAFWPVVYSIPGWLLPVLVALLGLDVSGLSLPEVLLESLPCPSLIFVFTAAFIEEFTSSLL
jgi:hypothetical protein